MHDTVYTHWKKEISFYYVAYTKTLSWTFRASKPCPAERHLSMGLILTPQYPVQFPLCWLTELCHEHFFSWILNTIEFSFKFSKLTASRQLQQLVHSFNPSFWGGWGRDSVQYQSGQLSETLSQILKRAMDVTQNKSPGFNPQYCREKRLVWGVKNGSVVHISSKIQARSWFWEPGLGPSTMHASGSAWLATVSPNS